jgi:phosphonate transport system substrate-binding protein
MVSAAENPCFLRFGPSSSLMDREHGGKMAQKAFWLILLTIFLVGCATISQGGAVGYVNLNDLQPLPSPITNDIRPLRVAIAAVISPQGSAESYAPLLDYLSRKLDRPVERVQRRTYSEVNDLIRRGEVDMAFVCTSSYLVGSLEFGMQLLAAPQVNGDVTYRAIIIVPSESPAQTFADLRGKVFAFTDPISFSGRVYPTYLLQEIEETPATFFSRTFFTYSHDDAIQAVADGLADGASVDSLVLDFALKREPTLRTHIRMIHTSPPFGMPPVVISPTIRPQLRALLEETLLNMDQDAEGRAALDALDYERFVPASTQDYKSAEAVEAAVGDAIPNTLEP